MRSGIKKIILLTVAMLFLGTGVSFAHDRYSKPPGNAYGHYKQKGHPVWHNKHPKAKWQHDRSCDQPRHYQERYHYHDSYRHRGGYEGTEFKLSVADPTLAFKIVVTDRKY